MLTILPLTAGRSLKLKRRIPNEIRHNELPKLKVRVATDEQPSSPKSLRFLRRSARIDDDAEDAAGTGPEAAKNSKGWE